jgi:hypothetical protein
MPQPHSLGNFQPTTQRNAVKPLHSDTAAHYKMPPRSLYEMAKSMALKNIHCEYILLWQAVKGCKTGLPANKRFSYRRYWKHPLRYDSRDINQDRESKTIGMITSTANLPDGIC